MLKSVNIEYDTPLSREGKRVSVPSLELSWSMEGGAAVTKKSKKEKRKVRGGENLVLRVISLCKVIGEFARVRT